MVENKVIYSKNKKVLVYFIDKSSTEFEIPNGIEEIGATAFAFKDKIEKVVLPGTIKYINGSAFNTCSALTRIEIPSSIETISNDAFSNYTNLREILINKKEGTVAGAPWGCIYGDRAIKWLQ